MLAFNKTLYCLQRFHRHDSLNHSFLSTQILFEEIVALTDLKDIIQKLSNLLPVHFSL